MLETIAPEPRRCSGQVRLPTLASGLRLAAVYAPIGAIIGEWVGASQGLGYLMLFANGRAMADLMFAALVVSAFLTLVLHAVVDKAAHWLVEHQTQSPVSKVRLIVF